MTRTRLPNGPRGVTGVWRLVLLFVLCVPSMASMPSCAIMRFVGIGGDEPCWESERYVGANGARVLELARSAFARNYPGGSIDLGSGRYASDWVFGLMADRSHEALRARVVVEVVPEGDNLLVRLRVQQEQSESAGRMVTHDPGDWQPFIDDPAQARLLMTKLRILMKELATTVPAETSGH